MMHCIIIGETKFVTKFQLFSHHKNISPTKDKRNCLSLNISRKTGKKQRKGVWSVGGVSQGTMSICNVQTSQYHGWKISVKYLQPIYFFNSLYDLWHHSQLCRQHAQHKGVWINWRTHEWNHADHYLERDLDRRRNADFFSCRLGSLLYSTNSPEKAVISLQCTVVCQITVLDQWISTRIAS